MWIKPNGQLILSDIKATSKNEFNWEVISNYNFSKGYKRQIEMYQWLFRKKMGLMYQIQGILYILMV